MKKTSSQHLLRYPERKRETQKGAKSRRGTAYILTTHVKKRNLCKCSRGRRGSSLRRGLLKVLLIEPACGKALPFEPEPGEQQAKQGPAFLLCTERNVSSEPPTEKRVGPARRDEVPVCPLGGQKSGQKGERVV